MKRREFLQICLAAGIAPAVVKAKYLMGAHGILVPLSVAADDFILFNDPRELTEDGAPADFGTADLSRLTFVRVSYNNYVWGPVRMGSRLYIPRRHGLVITR